MRDFRELQVWQKAHQLTLDIYKLSREFPETERYGLVSQLRRACSSVPTNISEGCGRESLSEFARFLEIAMGSACEVEYQLILAKDLGYISENKYQESCKSLIEVKRMLSAYTSRVRQSRKV